MRRSALRRLWKDRAGATAVEYALIAGLVALAIVGAVAAVGSGVGALFGAAERGFPG